MSILEKLGGAVAIALGALIAITIALAIITIASVFGGLIGALIATGYNILLGQSFDPLTAALAGSLIAVLGGSTAMANAGD